MQTNIVLLSHVASGVPELDREEIIIEIQPNLYFALTDMPVDKAPARKGEAPAFAALGVLLEGQVRTSVRGMEEFPTNSLLITSHDGKGEFSSSFHGGRRLRNVEVFLTPEWFESAGNAVSSDPGFMAVHEALSRRAFHRRLPMKNWLREVAHRSLGPIGTGAVAALRIEAAALDFLAALADGFGQSDRQNPMSLRDRERIQAAREMIETEPASIASIGRLAASHGVSASKLKRDFFIAYSTCVGSFMAEQRLLHGRRLLLEGASVSEAAYAVGYSHPGNFSTAFKRRFGVSPSQARN